MPTISRACGQSRLTWSLWRMPFTVCWTRRGWRRRSKLHSSRADVLRSSIGTPARERERQILGEPRGPKTELRLTPEKTIEVVKMDGLKFLTVVEISPYHYGAI